MRIQSDRRSSRSAANLVSLPAILAVPFDEHLISQGVHRSMALHLFKSHQLTLAQSAKMAGLSLEAFIELLGEVGIPAVDYPPEELEEEMTVAL